MRFLQAKIRLSDGVSEHIKVGVVCNQRDCHNTLTFDDSNNSLKPGTWQTVAIETGCENANVQANGPIVLRLSSSSNAGLSIADVAWVKQPSKTAVTQRCE